MKNLLNLKGAKLLSKVEQKSINGGSGICSDECQTDSDCNVVFGAPQECFIGTCDSSPTKMCRAVPKADL